MKPETNPEREKRKTKTYLALRFCCELWQNLTLIHKKDHIKQEDLASRKPTKSETKYNPYKSSNKRRNKHNLHELDSIFTSRKYNLKENGKIYFDCQKLVHKYIPYQIVDKKERNLME